MRVSDVLKLYEYSDWATTRILETAAKVSDEQFVGPPALGDRSLQTILVHALSTERGWRSGWQGLGRLPHLRDEDFPSVATIIARWREEAQQMRDYLATLSDDDLDGDFYGLGPIWQSMQHVLYHNMQHRSEAAMLLTGYGHSPGDIDMVTFMQQGG